MPLSWNEIKNRAVEFSTNWADASNEDAEAKSFLGDFFKVFGIESRKFGSFEHKVKKLDEHDGYIDLLWKQNILVEMKSRGRDLEKAYTQAKEYIVIAASRLLKKQSVLNFCLSFMRRILPECLRWRRRKRNKIFFGLSNNN